MYAVNKPIPSPTKPLTDYYTTFQVKERGWNPTMIQELMPRPDAARPSLGNQGGPNATVKLYLKTRVEDLETTEDYLIVEEQTRKRTEKRLKSDERAIADYVAKFKPRFGLASNGQFPKATCCVIAVQNWQRTNEAAAQGLSRRRLALATKALVERSWELFDKRYPNWQEPAQGI